MAIGRPIRKYVIPVSEIEANFTFSLTSMDIFNAIRINDMIGRKAMEGYRGGAIYASILWK